MKALIAGLIFLTIITGMFSPSTAASAVPPCTSKIVVAHEGYKANDAGDTVESQLAAYDIGANTADSDIWKTVDTEASFVQRHENDLAASTDGTGLITERTLEYIQGLWTTYHHERVPLLTDSLKLSQFAEDNRYLQFEIKWSVKGFTALDIIDQRIKRFNMSTHTYIYSTYFDSLRYMRAIDPDIHLLLKAGNEAPPIDELVNAGINGAIIQAGHIKKSDVDAYHAAGLVVFRGRREETLNGWKGFVANGADGIMTDQPDFIVPLCKELDK